MPQRSYKTKNEPTIMSQASQRIGLRKVFKWSFKTVFYIISLISSVVYLLSAYSIYIPPLRWGLPAVLGLMFPVVLLVQLGVMLLWLLRFRWYRVLPLVGVLLLSWPALRAYFPINVSGTPPLTEGQERIRVLTYNVMGFAFRTHSPASPNPVLQYIKASGADIVCLQEAYIVPGESQGVTERDIESYLGKEYPYWHHVPVQPNGGSTLVLLSRFPIKKAKRLDIRSRANGAVAYKLDVNGQEVLLINVHLESFRLTQRDGAEYMSLAKKGDAIKVKSVLQARFNPVFRMHNRQANYLHELIKKYGRERVIVCGDFNDTPVSYLHQKVGEGLQDAFIESGNGLGWTFSSSVFRVRIDHILCGTAFEPHGAKVDKSAQLSDHYPVITDLAIRKPKDK